MPQRHPPTPSVDWPNSFVVVVVVFVAVGGVQLILLLNNNVCKHAFTSHMIYASCSSRVHGHRKRLCVLLYHWLV